MNRNAVSENKTEFLPTEKINPNNIYIETFGNGFGGLPWGYDSTKLDSSFNVIKVLDNSEIVIFQRRSKEETVLDKVIADEVLYLFIEDKFIKKAENTRDFSRGMNPYGYIRAK